jgi:hypothetical protein
VNLKTILVRNFEQAFAGFNCKYAFAVILLLCSAFIRPSVCRAQATPDTTLNNIVDDTLHQRKAGGGVRVVTPQANPGDDTTSMIHVKKGPFQPNPKKAGLYSALIPGLGQLYNHNYWKVPVVYAGLGVAGYFFVTNLDNYQSYRKAYIGRISNPYPTDKYVGLYSSDQLQQLQNDYSKYLDLTVMFSTIGYALQVIDAVVSAHLKNFDISRDISLHMTPVATSNKLGLGLVMNFK